MPEGNSAYGRTRFRRSPSHFADRITADGRDGWPVAAGRYRLVVGRAWPWASRAVIARRLLCNRHKLTEDPVLWAYAPDLCQTPGFGDTIDFDHIKRHYHRVHTGINPTGIVPLGPNLADWLASHGRERLGGRPFGDGTPPGPVPADEEVPAAGRP